MPTATSYSPTEPSFTATKKGESTQQHSSTSQGTQHSQMLILVELIDLSSDDEAYFADSPPSEVASQPDLDLNQPSPLIVEYPSHLLTDVPSSFPPTEIPSTLPSDMPSSSNTALDSSFVQREGKAPITEDEPIPEPIPSPIRDPKAEQAQIERDYRVALRLQADELRRKRERDKEFEAETDEIKAKLIRKLGGMGIGKEYLASKSFSEVFVMYENLMFRRERRRIDAEEEVKRRRTERESSLERQQENLEEVHKTALKKKLACLPIRGTLRNGLGTTKEELSILANAEFLVPVD